MQINLTLLILIRFVSLFAQIESAVHSQCEEKEEYIEMIQTLDFDTKAAIASHIQEV